MIPDFEWPTCVECGEPLEITYCSRDRSWWASCPIWGGDHKNLDNTKDYCTSPLEILKLASKLK